MQVKDAADALRGLINLPLDEEAGDIVPADTPGFAKREISLDEALADGPEEPARPAVLRPRRSGTGSSTTPTPRTRPFPRSTSTPSYWSPGHLGRPDPLSRTTIP